MESLPFTLSEIWIQVQGHWAKVKDQICKKYGLEQLLPKMIMSTKFEKPAINSFSELAQTRLRDKQTNRLKDKWTRIRKVNRYMPPLQGGGGIISLPNENQYSH